MVAGLTGSVRGTKKVRDNQTTLQGLSKVVTLGGKYRIFFNTFPNGDVLDILAAVSPGRKCQREKLGFGFIPIRDYEVTEAGKVLDKTGLDSYARMSRVLHKSAELLEKANAQAEAEKSANSLGTEVDREALTKRLNEIDLKYNGDNTNPKNPIYATEQPMIGPVVIESATECLVVPLTPEGKPKWRDAKCASLVLSNTKITQLETLLDDPNFARKEDGYLEVGYTYVGTDKKEAGKNAAFQGIAESMSLKVTDPDGWQTEGLAALATMSKTEASIAARNYNMSASVSPDQIISAVKSYCSKHPGLFASINMEDEATKWAAKDFVKSGLVDKYTKVKEALENLVKQNGDEEIEQPVDEQEEAAKAFAANMPEGLEGLRSIAEETSKMGVDLSDGDLPELD